MDYRFSCVLTLLLWCMNYFSTMVVVCRLCVTFLAIDIVIVLICLLVACLVGIAVCCCLPCILAFLSVMGDKVLCTFLPCFYFYYFDIASSLILCLTDNQYRALDLLLFSPWFIVEVTISAFYHHILKSRFIDVSYTRGSSPAS